MNTSNLESLIKARVKLTDFTNNLAGNVVIGAPADKRPGTEGDPSKEQPSQTLQEPERELKAYQAQLKNAIETEISLLNQELDLVNDDGVLKLIEIDQEFKEKLEPLIAILKQRASDLEQRISLL